MLVYIKRQYSKKQQIQNDKTYDTIQVKLEQKPCQIKIAHLSE